MRIGGRRDSLPRRRELLARKTKMETKRQRPRERGKDLVFSLPLVHGKRECRILASILRGRAVCSSVSVYILPLYAPCKASVFT